MSVHLSPSSSTHSIQYPSLPPSLPPSVVYLQSDLLAESDVSGHGEVIELQHVRDALEPLQEVLHLRHKNAHKRNTSVIYSCTLPNAQVADVGHDRTLASLYPGLAERLNTA